MPGIAAIAPIASFLLLIMTQETTPSIRLFVAAALPEWIKDAFEGLYSSYRHEAVRFVPRENLHLTLHFIGNYPEAQMPVLDEKLQRLAKQFPSFRLRLQEVAPGPSLRNPRLIWARFSLDQVFEEISLALEREIGNSSNSHPHPIPHVTLARFRKEQPKPKDLPVEKNLEVPEVEINTFALWQSHLGQPHPQYVALKTYTLGLMSE